MILIENWNFDKDIMEERKRTQKYSEIIYLVKIFDDLKAEKKQADLKRKEFFRKCYEYGIIKTLVVL